jgi:glycosyltransferase involved in cell wall biosynthesis
VSDRALRIALLAYRGDPRSGGQGVYLTHLSRALVRAGHHVDVIGSPPYPELDPEVGLVRLPSLGLYRPEQLFVPGRRPRGAIDRIELWTMRTGSFPEPLAFSLRAWTWLRRHRRRYDVAHDNQCLGYGIAAVDRTVLPVIATVHHPITVERRLDRAAARTRSERFAARRWYGFVPMQQRVARSLRRLVTVSETARTDIVREFGVRTGRIAAVPIGVDADVYRPADRPPIPGRILAVVRQDSPLKGLAPLLEAFAKVRTDREAHLVVVGRVGPGDPSPALARRLGVAADVTFTGQIDEAELVGSYAEAAIAVVPSLYEGFSLPVVQAMACGLPVVASAAGAIPEVAGRDAETALLVPPGDADSLAAALRRTLDDAGLRARLGEAARRRVMERFTWDRTAAGTVEQYRILLEDATHRSRGLSFRGPSTRGPAPRRPDAGRR